MMKKSVLTGILSISLACLLSGTGMSEDAGSPVYTAGTYTATAQGNNGDVIVEVTFTDTEIASVEVTEHGETPGIGDLAVEKLPGAIVESQSLAVDTVSGATNTSNAILSCVADCVEQAGGSADALMEASSAQKEKEQIELEADVVVVGSGLSGTSAAMSAMQQGASVIMLEKLATTGGSAWNSEGLFLTIESDDTIDAAIADWKLRQETSLAESLYPDYDRLTDALLDTDELIDWFEDMGADYSLGLYQEMDSLPLMQANVEGSEQAKGCAKVIELMMNKLEEAGMQLYTQTSATELITDENQAVTGVYASSDEADYTIHANAVILACGGFGANEQWVEELLPNIAANDYMYMGVSGNTGDGMTMATAVGAAVYEDNYIIPCPMGFPAELYGIDAKFMKFQEGVGLEDPYICKYYLMVNKDGERFMNEGVSYPDANVVMIGTAQAPYYTLLNNLPQEWNDVLEEGLGTGYVFKGDTIEELAEAAGFDVDTFVETVDAYKKAVADQNDPEFGKDAEYLSEFAEEGPYYLLQYVPTFTGTLGGVKTDEQTNQVLREDGSLIEGLYAVGEMSNRSYYNQGYFTGSALSFASISGKRAGAAAAGVE